MAKPAEELAESTVLRSILAHIIDGTCLTRLVTGRLRYYLIEYPCASHHPRSCLPIRPSIRSGEWGTRKEFHVASFALRKVFLRTWNNFMCRRLGIVRQIWRVRPTFEHYVKPTVPHRALDFVGPRVGFGRLHNVSCRTLGSSRIHHSWSRPLKRGRGLGTTGKYLLSRMMRKLQTVIDLLPILPNILEKIAECTGLALRRTRS